MKANYIKLGAFILIGLVIFVGALYYLGTKNNLFVDKIKITSTISSAQGIQEGSNVRLAGIKVGVIEDVKIISDSTVRLTMMVNANDAIFIKKDAKVSIGTAGLMGNKIVNISDGTADAQPVEDGDRLTAKNAADLDNIKNSVLENSRNLEIITGNLVEISENLNNGNGVLGSLLIDTTLNKKVESIVYSLDQTSRNTVELSNDLRTIVNDMNSGKGTMGRLLTDESMSRDINSIIDTLKSTSAELEVFSANLREFSLKLNNDAGSLDLLLTDTTMAENLAATIRNAKQRSIELEESIEKVNNSWILNLFSGNKKDKKKKAKGQRSDDKAMTQK